MYNIGMNITATVAQAVKDLGQLRQELNTLRRQAPIRMPDVRSQMAAYEKQRIAGVEKFLFSPRMHEIYGKGLKETQKELKKTGVEKDRLAKNFGWFGGFVGDVFRRIRFFITTMLGGALLFGPVFFIRSAIRHFLDFEKAVTEIVVQIPRRMRDVWGEFANIAFDISRRVGKSAIDVAGSLRLATSVGFETMTQASEVAEAAARMSVASFADVGTATQTLTNLLNSFGLSSKEAGKTTDIMMAGWQVAGGEMNLFARGLGIVGSSVSSTGASMEDLIAITALLSRSAAGNSRIFIESQQAFQQLISPTGEAGDAMRALGVNIVRTKQGGVDFMNTLIGLNKRIDQLAGKDQARRFQLLAAMFPEQRGRRAIARFLAASPESIREVFDAVRNAHGSVGRAMNDVNVRAFRDWERLKHTFERTMISFGLAMVKALQPAVVALENFLKQFEVGQPLFDSLADHVTIFFARFLKGISLVLSGMALVVQVFEKLDSLLNKLPRFPTGGMHQPITPITRQRGGIVPGTGSGDIVPAMLEPGELVIPKNIVRRIAGGIGMQNGGVVPDDFRSWPEVQMFRGHQRYQNPNLGLSEIKKLDASVKNQTTETTKLSSEISRLSDGISTWSGEIWQQAQDRIDKRRRGENVAGEKPAPTDPTGAGAAYKSLSVSDRQRIARGSRTFTGMTLEQQRAKAKEAAQQAQMSRRSAYLGSKRDEQFQSFVWNPETRRLEARTFSMSDIESEKQKKRDDRIEKKRAAIEEFRRLKKAGPRLPGETLPASPVRMDVDIQTRPGAPASGRVMGGGRTVTDDEVKRRQFESKWLADQGVFPGGPAGDFVPMPRPDETGGTRIKRLPWEAGYQVAPDVSRPPYEGPLQTRPFGSGGINPLYGPHGQTPRPQPGFVPMPAASSPFNLQSSSGGPSPSDVLAAANQAASGVGSLPTAEVLAAIMAQLQKINSHVSGLQADVGVLKNHA